MAGRSLIRDGVSISSRPAAVPLAAGLAAVVVLLASGCGGGATSVELAEPLSPEETKQLIGGMRTNWTEGGETRPSDPEGADAGTVQPTGP